MNTRLTGEWDVGEGGIRGAKYIFLHGFSVKILVHTSLIREQGHWICKA
jgi:hypothetical protein